MLKESGRDQTVLHFTKPLEESRTDITFVKSGRVGVPSAWVETPHLLVRG